MTVVMVVPHMHTFVKIHWATHLKLVHFTAYTSIILTFKKHTKDLETGVLPPSEATSSSWPYSWESHTPLGPSLPHSLSAVPPSPNVIVKRKSLHLTSPWRHVSFPNKKGVWGKSRWGGDFSQGYREQKRREKWVGPCSPDDHLAWGWSVPLSGVPLFQLWI